MTALDQVRTWWQRHTGEEELPIDGDTPAWVVSMLVHVVVLVLLATVMVPPTERPAAVVSIEQPPFSEPELLEPEAMAVSLEPQDHVGAQSEESVDVAQSLAPVIAEMPAVPIDPPEAFDTEEFVEPFDDVVPQGLNLSETITATGAVAVGTSGASGAVDRLTLEIAAALEEKPTAVCWIFDQSVSLAGQRRDIASRLQRVFDELGAGGSGRSRPELYHLVFAYGERITPVIGRPTSDGAAVVDAIESIPVDDSGVELTFSAVLAAAQQANKVRAGRKLMLVVFTDEVGNDEQRADEVAAYCRRTGVPVYVVGVPAPFGRRQVQIKFVEFDPKYADGDVQWPVVDQGPESLYPELIRIASGSAIDEPIDSGFGPYSLSKLCAATGGIYFAVHGSRGVEGRVRDGDTVPMASRLRRFFDPEVMRLYQPEYLSKAGLDRALSSNKAKRALVDAASQSELQPVDAPQTVFPRTSDAQLSASFSEAQKEVARLQPAIDALHRTLSAGAGDRDTIREKRWQAGYDLAMGRVLAAKVRADAYNEMLGQAKSGLVFKKPDSDTWELAPSDDVSAVSSRIDKMAKEARTYLERVVAEHAGTPWAHIAGEELRVPMGYAWQEKHTGVAARQAMAGNNNNNNPRPDDMARKLAPPKPKRPLKNL
jgi:hypothetical protein